MLVLPYELMKENPTKFIESICKFSQIEDYESIIGKLPLKQRVNKQISPRDAYLNRTYSRIFGSNNSLETITSNKMLKSLFNVYRKLPFDFGGRLESEIKTTLKNYIREDYYRNSNILLQQRIKKHMEIDLKILGYIL